MAGEASKAIDKAVLWGGGRSPFSISYGKMMMWLFLVSDALTFGGLLVALGFMRHRYADVWPVSEEVFHAFPFMGETYLPLMYVALMTFILIVSSVTMVLAVEAGHRMDKKGVVFWLAMTVVGGFIFLGSQAWEWYHFIHGTAAGALAFPDGMIAHWANEAQTAIRLLDGTVLEGAEAAAMIQQAQPVFGANMQVNEYGPQLFANFFFGITGFHGFHVFTGVIINLIVLINAINGVYHERGHYEMVEKSGLYWHFVDLVWVFVFTFFYLV